MPPRNETSNDGLESIYLHSKFQKIDPNNYDDNKIKWFKLKESTYDIPAKMDLYVYRIMVVLKN